MEIPWENCVNLCADDVKAMMYNDVVVKLRIKRKIF